MNNDNSVALSKYRLEKSKECLKSAKALRDIDDYQGAANRSYYAIYHAIRSILALDGVEFKRHSGNMSYFRQNYIKKGLFDVELSNYMSSASETRNSSDYDDFYVISKEEVNKEIKNAEKLCDDINAYIEKRLNEQEENQ